MNEDRQLLGPLSIGILRDFWRDRTGNWSMENMQKFIVGTSKPPWWRLVARWRWRRAIHRRFPSRERRNEQAGEADELKEDLK